MRYIGRLVSSLIFLLFCIHCSGQIIADHTIVEDYKKIPSEYIAEVKKMMVAIHGESHSRAYRTGLELLELAEPAYSCNVSTGEQYTDQYLRVDFGPSTGEEEWFTWHAYPESSRPSASVIIQNRIRDYFTQGHPISVLGFGWCYDMSYGNWSTGTDPVYGTRWRGESKEGPDGNLPWGLDSEDYALTGNHVCLDDYIAATEEYITYCKVNSYPTRVVFTTGTVNDFGWDYGYQSHLKNERIRNYVRADTTRILFDYADILCYDDDGTPGTTTGLGHTYPFITAKNLGDESIGHIGSAGAIRLAKAQWWLLARIAGWDGTFPDVLVNSIRITFPGEAAIITNDNGTLQLDAELSPSDATVNTVTWSIPNGTENARISPDGIITALENGTVMVKATANDGSGVSDSLLVTISGQINPVTQIIVSSEDGITEVTLNGDPLKFFATVLPENATDNSVTWSVSDITGSATITQEGVISGLSAGTVKVNAIANDGSNVTGTITVSIKEDIPNTITVIKSDNDLLISGLNCCINCQINIFTLTGNLLSARSVNGKSWSLDISNFSSGIYFAVISGCRVTKVYKFVLP